MTSIVRWFLDRAPGPLRSVARWIADFISAAVNFVIGPLRSVASSWGRLYGAGVSMVAGILTWGGELYYTLLWIITVKIPTFVATRAAELRAWAVQVVNAAEARVRSFATWVKAQADAALKWLSDKVSTFISWASARVNVLLEFVQWLKTTLLPRLLSPSALAQWLVGAMVAMLFRYAHSRAEVIARWLLSASPAFTRWLAREIERILARLI